MVAVRAKYHVWYIEITLVIIVTDSLPSKRQSGLFQKEYALSYPSE